MRPTSSQRKPPEPMGPRRHNKGRPADISERPQGRDSVLACFSTDPLVQAIDDQQQARIIECRLNEWPDVAAVVLFEPCP